MVLFISFGYSAHAATDFLKFPDLKVGQTSSFVKELQKTLNNNGFIITNVGAGSVGQESTYFGSLTKKALVNFQAKNNIIPATGNFGVKTKAKLNEFFAAGKFKSVSSGVPVSHGSPHTCTSVTDSTNVVDSTGTNTSITWTFQGAPTCGQFVNGDWWVIGPVSITSITPAFTSTGFPKISNQNGSMINPVPLGSGGLQNPDNPNFRGRQGFTTSNDVTNLEALWYKAELNVAKSISATTTLVVPVSSSLVSSETRAAYPNPIRQIAVLTVLSEAPAQGSFRPSIYGTNKTIKWNRNNIDWSILKSLASVVGTPSKATIEQKLPGLPWFEWHENAVASVFIPERNAGTRIFAGDCGQGNSLNPNSTCTYSTYGQQIASKWGDIGMWLNLNHSQSDKEYTMIQTIQAGIDIAGYLENEGKLSANGGQRAGRKLPLVIAAAALTVGTNDTSLRNMASNPGLFQEDQQTFFVCGAADSATCPPGHTNDVGRALVSGRTYTQSQVGIADWGVTHRLNPFEDNPNFNIIPGIPNTDPRQATYYRHVNWPPMGGSVLTAEIMGLKSLWNHPAIFAYGDRHIGGGGGLSDNSEPFLKNMWIRQKGGTVSECTQNCGIGDPVAITHPAPDSFLCGDTVKAFKPTWVNSTASVSTPIGGSANGPQQAANATGIIRSGPTSAENIFWYEVDYLTGVDGFSGGDNFDLVSHGTCVGTETSHVLAAEVSSAGTGSGTFSGAGSFAAGTTATITANAASGSTFVSWSGCTSTSGNVCTVTMPAAAKTVTARFDLAVTAVTDSVISIAGAKNVQIGSTQTIAVTYNAQAGRDLVFELKRGDSIIYTTKRVAANAGTNQTTSIDVTIPPEVATGVELNYFVFMAPTGGAWASRTGFTSTGSVFATPPNVITFTLSASKPGTGTGFINGISAATTTLAAGTNITLTAEAASGSTFAGWGGACSGSGTALVCPLAMNANKAVTATFTLDGVVSNDNDGDGVLNTNDLCPLTPVAMIPFVNSRGCPKPKVASLKINSAIDAADLTNVSNLEIEDKNGAFGKIRYSQPVNIFGTTDKKSQIDLDSFITIKNKSVEIKSDLAPQFNKPATITLYDIKLTKPLIKKGGEVYATSSSPLMTYNAASSTLTFIVTGFSAYDVIEDTATFTLTASKSGNGAGSIVGVDSATTIFTEGTSITLTTTADSGSTFSGWSGACAGTGSCVVTMTANRSVDAAFAANVVPPATTGGGGSSGGGSSGGGGGGGSAPAAFVNPNNVGLGNAANTSNTVTAIASYTFVKDLKVNARDNEVIKLQQFLNAKGYKIATSGAGSPGLESNYFGPATRVALAKWQKDNGISPAVGYFGALTKATINKMGGTTLTVAAPAAPTVTATTGKYVFAKDLKVNSRDPEVIQLQKFLNSRGYVIASKGAGSPGLESNYFGPATRVALAKWQKDNGISPAVGFFGSLTKAALNK